MKGNVLAYGERQQLDPFRRAKISLQPIDKSPLPESQTTRGWVPFVKVSAQAPPFSRGWRFIPNVAKRGGRREISATCARIPGRSLWEKDLAWTESQTIHTRCDRTAGGLASRPGPSQYLGSNTPCSVLEIRGAAKDRRRKT